MASDECKNCTACGALCYRVHLNAGECVACSRKTTSELKAKVAENEVFKKVCASKEDVLIQELADGSEARAATDSEMRGFGYEKEPGGRWSKK